MKEIILWYNRNKKTILGILGIIIIAIILVQGLQWMTSQRQQTSQVNNINTQTNNETNLNTVILEEDKSTVTGTTLSKTQTDSLKVINEFVENCNNREIEKAYSLLSDDCKNEMYPSVTEFQENYYNKIFNGTAKVASIENWVGDIYKVKFIEDALSTGIYNSTSNVQDYITIVEDEEENLKININNYIGKKEINKSKEAFNIEVKVLEVHQYMDYEIYVYEVENGYTSQIWLTDIDENQDAIYLEDKNDIKYYAYMNELSQADLRLSPGETRNISIKYYNRYSSSRKITSCIFSKIELGGNEITSLEITL